MLKDEKARVRACVRACVCVWERERESVCVRVCVRACMKGIVKGVNKNVPISQEEISHSLYKYVKGKDVCHSGFKQTRRKAKKLSLSVTYRVCLALTKRR